MEDDKKIIGAETEKPGDASQEKNPEPVKDVPSAPEQTSTELWRNATEAVVLGQKN